MVVIGQLFRRLHCCVVSTAPHIDVWLFDEVRFSEYLVKNKYAAADKLTINGGSNGGTSLGSFLCDILTRSG